MTFPHWLSNKYQQTVDRVAEWRDSIAGGSVLAKWLFYLFIIYVLVVLVLSLYWSREPAHLDVDVLITPSLVQTAAEPPKNITGVSTTNSLILVASTLLDKPGGYLSNDIAPPGIWQDNIPNWEFGVLVQVRDLSKILRESFSRSQSQSTEDKDLVIAEPRFNFDNNSWILPSSESVYREAISHLEGYRTRLQDNDQTTAQFYARADNLRYWFGSVESRLGSLSQRLSASVGQRRINTDLAGEAEASQATPSPSEMIIQTPWSEIDDVFYEARGTAWALIHFLKAAEVDFADVLEKKNALISLRQIIRELEATQETLYSPMILNGSGFGMLVNHSLVMASYLSRAHAAIIDIRELLSQG